MKKAIKILIIAVLVVWLFASGLIAGTYLMRSRIKSRLAENGYTQSYTGERTSESINIDIVTDTAQYTENESEEVTFEIPADNGNLTTYESQTQEKAVIPSGNREIGEALVNAVNATKSIKSFTAVKKDKTDFVIDSVTGGNTVKNIVEGIIKKLGDRPETTYSFSNGTDSNGSGETPGSILAPKNSVAYFDESAIKSAQAAENSSGGYDVTLILNDETQTLSEKAKNHDGLFDTLDMSAISLPAGFKMNEVNFTYSGAQIKAGINPDGRLSYIEYSLPISAGSAQGSMLSAPVSVTLHGAYTSSVRITY